MLERAGAFADPEQEIAAGGPLPMINSVIHDARVECSMGIWHVMHPSNGAIIAYCATRAEALAYRDALNDIPRQLRERGIN